MTRIEKDDWSRAGQLESVVAWWENGADFIMLQPAVPYPCFALTMLSVETAKMVGKKERELLGASGASHTVAGASDWVQGKGDAGSVA